MRFTARGERQTGDGVRWRLVSLLALEAQIGDQTDKVRPVLMEHSDADSALRRFGALANSHIGALETRLGQLSGSRPGSDEESPLRVDQSSSVGARETAFTTLETLHRLLNEATVGYSALHAMAHRYYDSKDEGNTADLAEKHLREYADAVQGLNRLLSDVVVWELSKGGQECQCKCPSCGLGICLCSPHGTNTVIDIWREAVSPGAVQPAAGIRVRLPRAESAAHRAGLRAGDTVVAVDEQAISDETWAAINAMQKSIGKHASGGAIRFRVMRASGTLEEISVLRP